MQDYMMKPWCLKKCWGSVFSCTLCTPVTYYENHKPVCLTHCDVMLMSAKPYYMQYIVMKLDTFSTSHVNMKSWKIHTFVYNLTLMFMLQWKNNIWTSVHSHMINVTNLTSDLEIVQHLKSLLFIAIFIENA